MASKIYKKGVFLVIEDTVSGALKEFNTADVQIVKRNASLDVYEVLVLGVSQLKVNLADIQNENGSAYSENDWDVFRFNEVGMENVSALASNVSYDGTTSGLAATDVQAAIDEVQANVDALPAAPTTTVVNISSAQILAMGTTPIELLPAAGVGKYYDWELILEYTHVSTNYTFTNYLWLFGDTEEYGLVYDQFIKSGANRVAKFSSDSKGYNTTGAGSANYVFGDSLNSPLKLSTYDASNPTLGDGTLRAIITYTTRTFGA